MNNNDLKIDEKDIFLLFDKIRNNPKDDIQIILSELNITADILNDLVLEFYFSQESESIIGKDESEALENLLEELDELIPKRIRIRNKKRKRRSHYYDKTTKHHVVTKKTLINRMAEDADISNLAAKQLLETFLGIVEDSLKKGNHISLTGFGSFSVSKRIAREGRNPSTGKTIKIEAKNVVKFKAGTNLIKAIN